MKNIAIITAMDSEYNAVRSLYDFREAEGSVRARVNGKSIWLIKSGIGKVNGALAAASACRLGADLVISTGVAGGLDASLSQGDIVLADKCCYYDVWCGEPNELGQVQGLPLYYPTAEKLVVEILRQAKTDFHFLTGLTVTGDKFLTDENKLREIKQNYNGALAVDMESAAIAQACYLHNKRPYLSLRLISDVVGKPNQTEEYDQFWENFPTKSSEVLDFVLKTICSLDCY